MQEFTYKGEKVYWTGDEWLDATFTRVSKVVKAELFHTFRNEIKVPTLTNTTPTKSKSKKPKDTKSKGIRDTVDPIIVNYVIERYPETRSYIPYEEIADYLLAQPEINSFLQQAYAKTQKKKSFKDYVGNQVAWLGSNMDIIGGSQYAHLLEKTTLADGRKGYRPKQ